MRAPLPPFNAVLFSLSGCLVDFGARTATLPDYPGSAIQAASQHNEPTPGSLQVLQQLQQQSVPCAWLGILSEPLCLELARHLPAELPGFVRLNERPIPAPDSIWHALMALHVASLQGCVLVSGDPLVLQAALSAGLWTVGLAISGPLCGHTLDDWQNLPASESAALRSSATLALYRLSVHSVIDQLSELPACLEDIAQRRLNGEKP